MLRKVREAHREFLEKAGVKDKMELTPKQRVRPTRHVNGHRKRRQSYRCEFMYKVWSEGDESVRWRPNLLGTPE